MSDTLTMNDAINEMDSEFNELIAAGELISYEKTVNGNVATYEIYSVNKENEEFSITLNFKRFNIMLRDVLFPQTPVGVQGNQHGLEIT